LKIIYDVFNDKNRKEKRMEINYSVVFNYDVSNYYALRESKLMIDGVCWGTFSIVGHPFKETDENLKRIRANVMEIIIDRPYRDYGFSKLLIKELIGKIREMEPDAKDSLLLYVECDITDGFWDYVGMRYIDSLNKDEEEGLLKYITLRDLKLFANN
jgi:hypothetical protein